MRTLGAFQLQVEPETERTMPIVSITLVGAVPDEHGILHITPDCHRLDELEACINTLQDELDLMRAQARRIFTLDAGHA